MHRTSMQMHPGALRSTPDHSSAQHLVGGERFNTCVVPLNIDDREKRDLRIRAKFIWSLTDKGNTTPECKWTGWIASPVTWALIRTR